MTTLDIFTRSIARVTAAIAGLSLDAALEARLNAEFPGGGEFFRETRRACEEAIKAGWMCQQGEGARRFGRGRSTGFSGCLPPSSPWPPWDYLRRRLSVPAQPSLAAP